MSIFFSRETLEYSYVEHFLDDIKKYTSNKNIICYVNFLYKLPNGITQEQLTQLKTYVMPLDDLFTEYNSKASWPPQCFCRIDALNCSTVNEDPSRIFTNESFTVAEGQIVSSYRKSTYCKEDDYLLSEGWSYYYGYGSDIKQGNSHLASVIHQNVYTDICLDINVRIRQWLSKIRTGKNLATYQKALEQIPVLQRIIATDYPMPFDRFHLHIIQSNSTQIANVVGFFPEPQVVVQSDSIASNVFLLQIPRHIKAFQATSYPAAEQFYMTNIFSIVSPFEVTKDEELTIIKQSYIDINFQFLLYHI